MCVYLYPTSASLNLTLTSHITVKTVVNAAGNENGRATLSFERSLYYPSVSLYQLQTQCLHLTICGRNATTTQSFPIATTCIPLMIAIKQHQPTWYQISYNPDLAMDNEGSKMISVQQTWDRNEGELPSLFGHFASLRFH